MDKKIETCAGIINEITRFLRNAYYGAKAVVMVVHYDTLNHGGEIHITAKANGNSQDGQYRSHSARIPKFMPTYVVDAIIRSFESLKHYSLNQKFVLQVNERYIRDEMGFEELPIL
jgi:hypothetical protein